MENPNDPVGWHGTTILCVRRDGKVAMAGDGQVSLGNTVVKGNARKVRRIGNGAVIAGFAGATADAFTLLERLEAKLERFPNQLERACVELARVGREFCVVGGAGFDDGAGSDRGGRGAASDEDCRGYLYLHQ
jgi:hypothetical protein